MFKQCSYQLSKKWRGSSTSTLEDGWEYPRALTLGFYTRSGQLQLPLSSVVEEFKVAKCRLALTYRHSRDQLTREAGVRTRSGRKGPPARQLIRQNVLLGPKTSSETLALEDRVLEEHISSSGQSPPLGRREP